MSMRRVEQVDETEDTGDLHSSPEQLPQAMTRFEGDSLHASCDACGRQYNSRLNYPSCDAECVILKRFDRDLLRVSVLLRQCIESFPLTSLFQGVIGKYAVLEWVPKCLRKVCIDSTDRKTVSIGTDFGHITSSIIRFRTAHLSYRPAEPIVSELRHNQLWLLYSAQRLQTTLMGFARK